MDGGMANQRMRDIIIRTNTGHEIVRAVYNKGEFDVAEDMGILYKYPEDGTNKMVKVSAGEKIGTPGIVPEELVPEKPVSINTETTPMVDDQTTSPQKIDNIEISADADDDFLLSTLTLHYKSDKAEDYKTLNLEIDPTDGLFHHIIPVQDVIDAEKLEYYFEATNGFNTTTTDVSEVDIQEIDDSNVPPLLITEITPDSQNLNGANAYEFIEVYNTTDQEIDFGNFRILYRGPLATSDTVWFDELHGTMIEPGGNLVLWVDNGKNEEATIEDFKNNYGITEDINIVKAPAGGGMANGSERDLGIGTSTGEKFVTARYNDGGVLGDVVEDKGIFYHYPIGSDRMIKVRAGEDATPGTVEDDLVPENLTTVDPEAKMTIEDKTDVQSAKPGDSIQIVASAEDDFVVTNMKLNYKFDSEEEFTSVDLTRDEDRLFNYTIDVPEDETSEKIEYYFEGDNGFTTTESEYQEITFDVTKLPNKPSHPKPENGADGIDTDVSLSVEVSDDTGSDLDVTFFEGKSFNTSLTDQVKIYENSVSVEPPNERVPEGETELSKEDYEKLSALNGETVSLDSDDKFPYQRFEVTLDESSLAHDTVEAVWHGSSLEGRKVSLYAWNLETEMWDMVDHNIADSEDVFTLRGDVSVEDYVDGQTLNILVQDEISVQDSDFEIGDDPDFADFDYNFVWLADTQFYTESFPWHYENQVNWIAENKDEFNIEYVFHSGDIVNSWNKIFQWEFADEYMKVLEDADVPYGILAGNHDVELPNLGYQNYYEYFGEDRFKDQPYYGGSFQNNRGHYDLISVQGVDFIMVHMGWQPQEDGIAWMNDVLQEHPNRIAILNFHQYLDMNGITDMGQTIFDEVVVPNPNVQVVIGGHHLGSNVTTQEVEDEDGSQRVIYELLGNFQGESEGGLGYLNMMSMDIDSNSMYVTSYSPSVEYDPEEYEDLNPYNFYDDTPYRVPLDLEPMTKNVATDFFEVNTYTDEVIGTVTGVASGETATQPWTGLEADSSYFWYVTATNEAEETAVSNMFSFQTEEVAEDIDIAHIRALVDSYVNSGDIQGPLSNQLTKTARQAEHHYDAGRMKQDNKILNNFFIHKNKKKIQKQVPY